MVGFIDTFKEAWNTPSVDMSEVLREQENAELIRQALDEARIDSLEQIAEALRTYGYSITIQNNGVIATITGGNTLLTDANTRIRINNVGGILTVEELADKGQLYPGYKANPTSVIEFDESDSDHYNARYSSIDASHYREDGSNIAFLRIINNASAKREVIFPNFTAAPSPGITNNKFKQFIVMQSSVAHQERMQIVETNRDYQALFFGKKTEVLQVAGVLKNTLDNPWTMNMIFLWDELMRGTKLVENGYICQLFIDGELFEGYPFNFNRSKSAGSDNITNFNFSFLIKSRVMVVYSQSKERMTLEGQ